MGRKIPMWQVLIVILFSLLCFAYAYGVLGKVLGDAFACSYGELHIPLVVATLFATVVAIANGYKWSFLENGILVSINRAMGAILILMTVGILMGAWIAGGVVPAMIYYGLMVLKPSFFLIAACILCAICALATGSSWTTVGTIGVALIGIGTALGMSPAMTGGAIVSGAYFGDKMSPMSDTTNLAPAMAGATLFDHIRHMMWTVTPSLLIALIVYAILGLGHSGEGADLSMVTMLQENIKANFTINLAMLIPPLIVILMVAFKLPALPGLFGGIVLGVLCGSIFQGVHLADWFGYLHYGFAFADPDSVDPFVVSLLTRGGLEGMMYTISMGFAALCFGGVMDASGMLQTLTEAMLKLAKGRAGLVIVTVVTTILVNVVACDQYLSILLPGAMFKESFEDAKLAPKNLSRILEDAGTVTSPIIPWTTCSVTMSGFMGVPTVQYAPYAVLNYVNPLVSIFYGITGISMEKMTDEQYEKVLAEREQARAEALAAAQA